MEWILVLNCVKEQNIVRKRNEANNKYFEEDLDILFNGSLDQLDFTRDEIDKRYYILDDGGSFVKLKDGRVFNVCYRYYQCSVWEEDDQKTINYINMLINKYCK